MTPRAFMVIAYGALALSVVLMVALVVILKPIWGGV